MSQQGWIKIHRNILEWEWHDNPNVGWLFLNCLLNTNHSEGKWRGTVIKKGSFISSHSQLAKQTGLSVRQIRVALNKLKLTGELTIKTTNKYSVITISNWDKYQTDDKQDVSQMTGRRQADDRQMTTNKNDKNEKKEKNDENLMSKKFLKKQTNLDKEMLTPQELYDVAVDVGVWITDVVKKYLDIREMIKSGEFGERYPYQTHLKSTLKRWLEMDIGRHIVDRIDPLMREPMSSYNPTRRNSWFFNRFEKHLNEIDYGKHA